MTGLKETIRSGRRANFYITENSFIDHYAAKAGLGGIAVYHVLERYMNSETRSTWVGTAKIAQILDLSQRTVQRHLKTLEDLGLIRVIRSATMTVYVVLPVPQPPKTATVPLFDGVSEEDILHVGAIDAGWATSPSRAKTPETQGVTLESHGTTPSSEAATMFPRLDDISDAPNKEEQESFNKTYKQEEQIKHFRSLGHSSGRDTTSADAFTAALPAARRIMSVLALPGTPGNLTKVAAAVASEADLNRSTPVAAAESITRQAIRDRSQGVHIDGFYFEGAKWRRGKVPNAGTKAEQRKFANLEVNARVKQRFKERFGSS